MLVPVEPDITSGAVHGSGVRPMARAGWTAAVVMTAAVVILVVLNHPWSTWDRAREILWAVAWIGSGALLLLRATSTSVSVLVGCTLIANGIATPVSDATSGTAGAVVGRGVLGLALTLGVVTLSVFPDGRFVPGWLKGVCVGFGLWQVAAVAGTTGTVLDVVGGVVFFVGFAVPVGAQVARYRNELDPAERAKTKWVVYGFCTFLALSLAVALPYFAPGWFPNLVAPGSPYDNFQNGVSTLALLVIPVCFTLAMLVGNLFDVDAVISRTLVYGTLSVVVTAGYLGIVGVFGVLVGRQHQRIAPLIAATVVAVLFGPLRSWLQVRVRRVVYGLRAEPYAALSELGRQLATSTREEDVPTRLVSTIRRSMRAPYVAVAVGDEAGFPIAAESGAPTSQRLTLPLMHRSEQVGTLLVGYDARHPLSPADRALLADLCSQAGGAIHSVQLMASLRQAATQLQLVREELVLSREESRRRLRRDLHDGLAPTLAAAGLIAETAAELAEREPAKSGRLLAELQGTLKAAVSDIRAIVDDLRPPALDELGLVQALRERTSDFAEAIIVEVGGPDTLPPLPAAVEVAAFRICQEALMNVLKHSGASKAWVTISVGDGLDLGIEDDGSGLDDRGPGGVGLASMHERAAELGGRCSIADSPTGGTRVSVWLPLRVPSGGAA